MSQHPSVDHDSVDDERSAGHQAHDRSSPGKLGEPGQGHGHHGGEHSHGDGAGDDRSHDSHSQGHGAADRQNHGHGHEHDGHGMTAGLTRQAISATTHCLTGCAIGEILGMVLSTWWGWSTGPSIVLSIALAFFFGYSLTISPVLRAGVSPRQAIGIALAADTASITTMEIVDNAFLLVVPGAMAAGLTSGLFWSSLVLSLAVAFVITVPVNRALIARGKGHAVVHQYH
jgi:hypothetical protein